MGNLSNYFPRWMQILRNNEGAYKMSGNNLVDQIIEGKQLFTEYQPIVHLDSEVVYGYEGLTRSSHPNVSSIIELIEMAEIANKIQELDLLMMERVIFCFQGQGKLFINVIGKSAESISDFLVHMVQTAENVGFPIENIVIELSERTMWNQESLNVIKEFKKRYNFLLAIDDFGVGFSNYRLLLEAQPDIVKIDRTFIQKIYEDKRKYVFIKAFIKFIKGIDMRIICEGIEEEAELNILKTLGSDYGQGYHLGKPKVPKYIK